MSRSIDHLPIRTLNTYLQQQISGFGELQFAEKFSGGQSNPTYLLGSESGKYVLRRKPPGKLLKSAHAIDREYRVIKALRDTNVPVAKAYHLCEDESIIGSAFYVMSFEEGRIFWDPSLVELKSDDDRCGIHEQMIDVLAALHEVDVTTVGLGDYGKPGNFFERQIGRWTKQYQAAETRQIDEMTELIAWLPKNMPPDSDRPSLIHGDYRLDNVMFDHHRTAAIAVLDWELSTLGHPLSDLGYYCMCLRLPKIGEVQGLQGVDRQALNIPAEAEMIERYCRLRNLSEIENWPFYLAFSFFRLAAIAQGVYQRSLQGNASNAKAAATGLLVEPLAQQAVHLIR